MCYEKLCCDNSFGFGVGWNCGVMYAVRPVQVSPSERGGSWMFDKTKKAYQTIRFIGIRVERVMANLRTSVNTFWPNRGRDTKINAVAAAAAAASSVENSPRKKEGAPDASVLPPVSPSLEERGPPVFLGQFLSATPVLPGSSVRITPSRRRASAPSQPWRMCFYSGSFLVYELPLRQIYRGGKWPAGRPKPSRR